MQQQIALSHAGGPAAEAILERLSESGIRPDSLVLLDHESRLGNRIAYAGSHLRLQDQAQFDLSGCALLLMPEADDLLEARTADQGCLLLSHAIDEDEPVFLQTSEGEDLDLAYSVSRLRLAGAEVSCLLPVLLELNRSQPLQRINIVTLRSVEFHGKAGIEELASQTVSLLNGREVKPGIFPQQMAFNLLTQAADAALISDLSRFLGNSSYSIGVQTLTVPVFHGFAAAVQLEFSSSQSLEDSKKQLSRLDRVKLENGPISPISDCNQSFSCVISHLEQAADQPSSLRFWVIADPMRYGLANNYVNVTEFLLKSFL